MNRDFMGIVLEVGQSSKDAEMRRLYEDVRDGHFVDMSVYNIPTEKLDESASEPLSYQGLKVVKEKFGRGVSAVKGDTEFRFTSDKYNADELEHRIGYLLEHQDADKVQSWLSGNTFCYMRQNLNEESAESKGSEEPIDEGVGDRIIGNELTEGDFVKYKGKTWVIGSFEERHNVGLVNVDKEIIRVPQTKVEVIEGTDVTLREKNLSKRICSYRGPLDDFFKKTRGINESTQASDVATKTDSTSLNKEPKEGVAYEFEDGIFVVDSIIEGVVYLIGPDDEYYSMKVEDFQNEVISSLDEAELDYEVQVEKDVNRAFSGWVIEKVNDDTDKTGIVMYAISNGEDDVVIFVHLGEETYEIYSETDDEAPELEGDLENIKSDLNKMAKYFK